MTDTVPWGYVCGYPTERGKYILAHLGSVLMVDLTSHTINLCFPRSLTYTGDLYGGAHYSPSCSASLTPQGRAMQEAAIIFGDGATLPFTPCKKGYIPLADGQNMFACPLHNESRQKRVAKEGGFFRNGEVDLNEFWSRINNSVGDPESPDVAKHTVKKTRVNDKPKLERE